MEGIYITTSGRAIQDAFSFRMTSASKAHAIHNAPFIDLFEVFFTE